MMIPHLRFKARSRGPRREPGVMNSLEKSYSAHLDLRKAAGEVADWKFDCFKLRLAKLCYLTVDFVVMLSDGTIEFHETKGFMQDDALVKLKMAAESYWWFRFVLVKAVPKRDGGGFSFKQIGE